MKTTQTPKRKYGRLAPCAGCDIRDEKLTNDNTVPTTEVQRRFLEAYELKPVIASAAKSVGVSRCTVYRWLQASPAFEKALQEAVKRNMERNRQRWEQWNEARKRWRAERERARRPMRCANLAKARASYKQALKRRGGRKHRQWD